MMVSKIRNGFTFDSMDIHRISDICIFCMNKICDEVQEFGTDRNSKEIQASKVVTSDGGM